MLIRTDFAPADASVLTIFSSDDGPSLNWYRYWLEHQLRRIGLHETSLLQVSAASFTTPTFSKDAPITKIFCEVSRIVKTSDNLIIGQISERLRNQNLFEQTKIQSDQPTDYTILCQQDAMVFIIIGLQTMFWTSATLMHPYMSISKSIESRWWETTTTLPLHHWVRQFSAQFPSPIPDKIWKSNRDYNYISLKDMNWFLLHKLGQISIVWVDSLTDHLVLDTGKRILYLFRYPSFAARCLDELEKNPSNRNQTMLHA
jgi:hypothetical protein